MGNVKNKVCSLVLALLTLFIYVCEPPSLAAGSSASGFYVVMASLIPYRDTKYYFPSLAKPYVDGAAIMLSWSTIQPNAPSKTSDGFDWSSLDPILQDVIAQKKKLAIGIVAGHWTPAWLYSAPYSVPHCTFNISVSAPTDPCRQIQQPCVWNPTFEGRYAAAIKALSAHLQSLPGAAQAVTSVKIAGIGVTTEEYRIVGHACGVASGNLVPSTDLDIAQAWVNAGFTPQKVIDATLCQASIIQEYFPGKIMTFDIIGRGSFPPIDNNGCIETNLLGTQPDPDHLTGVAIASLLHAMPGKILVQWDALNNTLNVPSQVLQAGTAGALIGWQMNGFLGNSGSGCVYGNGSPTGTWGTCLCRTNNDFQSIVENGIKYGGQYFELQAPSISSGLYDTQFTTNRAELAKALQSTPSTVKGH